MPRKQAKQKRRKAKLTALKLMLAIEIVELLAKLIDKIID